MSSLPLEGPKPEEDPLPTPLSPHEQRLLRACLITLGILIVGTQIGVATSPYLVNNYPLLLVGISPLSRHVILVTPIVSPWWLLLTAGLRTFTFSILAFMVGRILGETALVWLENRSEGVGRFVRMLERFFERWSYLAVFFFPLGAMACIAGVGGMRPVGFLLCAVPGIAFRLGIYIWFADSLREPIKALLELIRSYQGPATGVLIFGIAAYQLFKWRRRRSG
jgi:membrane protein DedA with SNARE-associated domain